jgi:hypothetical protein
MNKNIFIFVSILIFTPILSAQDIKPVLSTVKYQIVTESVLVSNDPQTLDIEINKETNEDIQSFILATTNLKTDLFVVSAKLNDEQIWLIRSDKAAKHNEVLAWNYNRKSSQLKLFPPGWRSNYRLELTLQINLIDEASDKDGENRSILAEAEVQGRTYLCTVQGRGNEVIIKNRDEQ